MASEMDLGELVIYLNANATGVLEGLNEMEAALKQSTKVSQETGETSKQAAEEMSKGWADAYQGVSQYAMALAKLSSVADNLVKALNTKKVQADNAAAWKKTLQAYKDNKTTLTAYNQVVKEMGEAFGYTGDSVDDALSAVDGYGAAIAGDIDSIVAQIMALILDIDNLKITASQEASMNLDTSGITSKLQGLIPIANNLLSLLQAVGISTGSKPSGGGGGGGTSRYQKDIDAMEHQKSLEQINFQQELAHLEYLDAKYRNRRGRSTLSLKNQRDLEERIFAMKENIRKEGLDNELDRLDHLRAMDELTADAEIAALEKIKATHKLTTEEMWDLDEQLYALRKDAADEAQQAQEDQLSNMADTVENTYDRVVEALEKRYEAERALEKTALQDKIDALDALTAAENEAEKGRSYEESLADLQYQMRIERSARKRRELQEKIDDLVAKEELRQTQLERDKEKDALQSQMDAVDEKYDTLIQEENLRQEALRLCMSGNLDQMTTLIESYGDQWESAGASLAEALTQGIIGNSGGLLSTIQAAAEQMNANVQSQLLAASRQAVSTQTAQIRYGDINLKVDGLTVREEADIKKVATKLYDMIQSEGRGV